MDIFKASERMMRMDDAAWLRHANPWSVWTRFAVLPLICLAVWSRVWLGWWSLVPIAAALFWVWYNPRAFPPPERTDSWAARGTFGERIFLEHRKGCIRAEHIRVATVLTLLAASGVPILIFGLWALDFWATVCGVLVIGGFKAWFVDRMVWIYDEYKGLDPRYAAWLRN